MAKEHTLMARSRHFERRAVARALPSDVRHFIELHGTEFHALGAVSLTIVHKNLAPSLRHTELAARARDWIVVTSADGVLITCYRRRGATKFLRRKGTLSRFWHGSARRDAGRAA